MICLSCGNIVLGGERKIREAKIKAVKDFRLRVNQELSKYTGLTVGKGYIDATMETISKEMENEINES